MLTHSLKGHQNGKVKHMTLSEITTAEEIAALMEPREKWDTSNPEDALVVELLESHAYYKHGRFSFVKSSKDGKWMIYWNSIALPWSLHLELGLPGEYSRSYDTLWEAVSVTQSPWLREILNQIDACTERIS